MARDLKANTMGKLPLKAGSQVEDFTAVSAFDQEMSLDYMLEYGPLVVAFYQGGWANYSNERLLHLQKYLDSINKIGANLIAISPEIPQEARKTIIRNKLDFYILHDEANILAKKFQSVAVIPTDKQQQFKKGFYRSQGRSLKAVNGIKADEYTLPTPATFVIAQDRSIVFSHLPKSQKEHVPISDILAALKTLKASMPRETY